MTTAPLRWSANLGFLYLDLPVAERVRAAARDGFHAVEFHWLEAEDAGPVRQALADTGLPALGLNAERGNVDAGDFGLAAVPGREAEARSAIDRAVMLANKIGVRKVHVLAGRVTEEQRGDALAVFKANLRYASQAADTFDIGILIEPLNKFDVPDYFLGTVGQAARVLKDVDRENVQIMFDLYHAQRTSGSLLDQFRTNAGMIGHIQFAGVPDRGEPDQGEVNYAWLLPRLVEAGYKGHFGAEYRPRASTEDGLEWMNTLGKDAP
jgi:hydroxypyruvate isomerase